MKLSIVNISFAKYNSVKKKIESHCVVTMGLPLYKQLSNDGLLVSYCKESILINNKQTSTNV